MSRNSPSARKHRALKFLAHLVHYKKYGPLIGPHEAHQPEHRWPGVDGNLVLFVAQIFPHAEGQALWWESYTNRTPAKRQELVDDLQRRVERDQAAG